mgnify:CR=1 FL=1
MRLVSIDPGLTGTGVAIWNNGELVLAQVIAVTKYTDHIFRIRKIVEGVERYTRDASLIIEQPQTYRGRAAKGDANDLIKLANLVGALSTLSPLVEIALPSTWKGQAPAEVVEARGRAALTFEELQHVDLSCSKKHQTDVWHAVGLGLWKLGRVRRLPLTKSNLSATDVK